jgi:hypothetical protein
MVNYSGSIRESLDFLFSQYNKQPSPVPVEEILAFG